MNILAAVIAILSDKLIQNYPFNSKIVIIIHLARLLVGWSFKCLLYKPSAQFLYSKQVFRGGTDTQEANCHLGLSPINQMVIVSQCPLNLLLYASCVEKSSN